MSIKVILSFLLVVGVAAVLAIDSDTSILGKVTRCSRLPKIVTNAKEALEPFKDNWRLYKSLRPIELCVRFQFISDPKNPSRADGILTHKYLGKFTANITIDKKMNEWDVYNNFDGRTAKFYTAKYNKDKNYWCVYTCEHNGLFIEDYRCFALNKKGKDALDKDLQRSPKLPLKLDETLLDVYGDQCDKKSS